MLEILICPHLHPNSPYMDILKIIFENSLYSLKLTYYVILLTKYI